ncbi:Hypothetical predicted protein [Paramuricea clavata]|uniref:Uncharacterized protein n=1 Tax=Paramuricea clavata TaxID=317549 RepID=A0A6S7FH95_PARCT|nr:Hypothetical predicted protein [Paramuricea clavata]
MENAKIIEKRVQNMMTVWENVSNHRRAVVRKEDKIVAEIEELKNLYGDRLPPYKYRLWAEMIIVGTATRESIPDVPMFSTSPAKWPRRDNLSETITAVGRTIACALTPGAGSSKNATASVEQVRNSSTTEKAKLRSEVIKQVKDLFDLKQLGAITEEEYEEKRHC